MIGILGGTFDPPHWGHIKLALNFIEKLELDELIWLPAGQPWQKSQQITPSAIRYALTQAAIADLEALLKGKGISIPISISRIELDRHGPSYTIDTAKILREIYGAQTSLVWLMGADSYKNIRTWNNWEELPNYLHLAVANRPISVQKDEENRPELVLPELQNRLTNDVKELQNQASGKVFFDDLFHVELSSTQIRSELQDNLREATLLKAISPRVLELIYSLGIYQKNSAL